MMRGMEDRAARRRMRRTAAGLRRVSGGRELIPDTWGMRPIPAAHGGGPSGWRLLGRTDPLGGGIVPDARVLRLVVRNRSGSERGVAPRGSTPAGLRPRGWDGPGSGGTFGCGSGWWAPAEGRAARRAWGPVGSGGKARRA